MSQSINNRAEDLGDGAYHLSQVGLKNVFLWDVYFGPGGVFVISEPESDGKFVYEYLRKILEISRIKIYITGEGLYDEKLDMAGPELSEDSLTEEVTSWVFSGPLLYKPVILMNLTQRLILEEAKQQGSYRASDGKKHVYINGQFYESSPKSGNVAYLLTLFGGSLGLHRFYLGSFFKGLMYLFTAGFFGIGWILDVILSITGRQKDRRKLYVISPKKCFKTFALIPFGIATGLFLILLYLESIKTFMSGISSTAFEHIGSAGSDEINAFLEFIMQYLAPLIDE